MTGGFEDGGLDQAQGSRAFYCLNTVLHAKLTVDVVDVRFDGADGNEQFLGDLRVR